MNNAIIKIILIILMSIGSTNGTYVFAGNLSGEATLGTKMQADAKVKERMLFEEHKRLFSSMNDEYKQISFFFSLADTADNIMQKDLRSEESLLLMRTLKLRLSSLRKKTLFSAEHERCTIAVNACITAIQKKDGNAAERLFSDVLAALQEYAQHCFARGQGERAAVRELTDSLSARNVFVSDTPIALSEESLQELFACEERAFIPLANVTSAWRKELSFLMPYEEDIWCKFLKIPYAGKGRKSISAVYVKVRFVDTDGQIQYAHMVWAKGDKLDAPLSKDGIFCGVQYKDWVINSPFLFYSDDHVATRHYVMTSVYSFWHVSDIAEKMVELGASKEYSKVFMGWVQAFGQKMFPNFTDDMLLNDIRRKAESRGIESEFDIMIEMFFYPIVERFLTSVVFLNGENIMETNVVDISMWGTSVSPDSNIMLAMSAVPGNGYTMVPSEYQAISRKYSLSHIMSLLENKPVVSTVKETEEQEADVLEIAEENITQPFQNPLDGFKGRVFEGKIGKTGFSIPKELADILGLQEQTKVFIVDTGGILRLYNETLFGKYVREVIENDRSFSQFTLEGSRRVEKFWRSVNHVKFQKVSKRTALFSLGKDRLGGVQGKVKLIVGKQCITIVRDDDFAQWQAHRFLKAA